MKDNSAAMPNPFKPIRSFGTRNEVQDYLEETSENEKWKDHAGLNEIFPDDECLVSNTGKLLIVPKGTSDKLRRRAELYTDYRAFWEMETSPIVPFVEGFKAYLEEPEAIDCLASDFLKRASLPALNAGEKVIHALDTWLEKATASGDMHAVITDNETLCGICATVGAIIRKASFEPLSWQVRPDVDSVTATRTYPADLVRVDGTVISISQPLAGQIADPDHSSSKRIVSSFIRSRLSK